MGWSSSRAVTGVYENLPRGIVAVVFRAHVTGGRPTVTEETTRLDWWTRNLVSARMPEAYALRVFDALDGGHVTIRSHDGTNLIHDAPARH